MKKKIIASVLMSALIVCAASCGNTEKKDDKAGTTTTTTAASAQKEETTTTAAAQKEETTTTTSAKEEETTTSAAAQADEVKVMTYDEFKAAAIDDEVTVETYVQAKQSWWEKEGQGVGTFYTQSDDHGAYFLYEMPCSKEDYDKLTPGTKIRVTGFKAEWSGEVEIADAKFEILDGTFTAKAEDVTALLGKDELADHMNEFVSFKGMTVEKIEAKDDNGNVIDEGAFFYKSNNSGAEGDDLYFNASKDGSTYTFTVESYLCGSDTDVYKAVKELQIGDKIDMEGFLYWYNGAANPHITAVSKAQ